MTTTLQSNQSIYVGQGEVALGDHPETQITTLLGSCVSVCLHCPNAMVGGMNHILLPDDMDGILGKGSAINSMESLINPLVRMGAQRESLEAKVFGGSVFSGALGNIGTRNVEFVLDFLSRETIPCSAQSVGGRLARRIKFWPATGRAQQKLVAEVPIEKAPVTAQGNGLELF